MIAALYVDPKGIYAGRSDVDCWDEARDARLYSGPWPVVAHPPCQRWGNFWRGGLRAGKPMKDGSICPIKILGDDGGCFSSALAAVRQWGGVLEHPAGSRAWAHLGLPAPPAQGWVRDLTGGWSCQVEQGHYGHPARKATWLYAVSRWLPPIQWGRSGAKGRIMYSSEGRSALKCGQFPVSRATRHLTPAPFAELLLSIARSCLILLLLFLATPAHAYGRADVERCLQHWPEIETAADIAGVPEPIMFGLLLRETGCRPIEGWYADVSGPGQVSWPVMRWLLGPEGWRRDDLLDPYWGILAAGRVLGYLRERFPEKSIDQVLCIYAIGWDATRFQRDCSYSRAVQAAAREAR